MELLIMGNVVKRVAIFCDFLNVIGGTEYYNTMLAKSLANRGIDVRVFIGEKPKSPVWKDILDKSGILHYEPSCYHVSLKDRSIEKVFIHDVEKIIDVWKPDIIHTNPAGKLMISWFELNKKAIPIVATEWTTPCLNASHWYQADLPLYLNKIDAFISTCHASKFGIKNFLHYKGKIFIIPHLIEEPINKSGLRSPLQSIGCISRLAPEKGVVFLLGSWRSVLDKYPEACLSIYGTGQDMDFLKDTAQCLGIANNVEFKDNFLPFTEIDKIANRHTIFVQPSLFESIPTSIIELMLRGKIIIATDVGGIRELVNDKTKSGVLIKSASTEAISTAIIELLSGQHKMDQMSKNALNLCVKKYNLEKNITKILKVYQFVLGRS